MASDRIPTNYVIWGRRGGTGPWVVLGKNADLASAQRLGKFLVTSGYAIVIRLGEEPPPSPVPDPVTDPSNPIRYPQPKNPDPISSPIVIQPPISNPISPPVPIPVPPPPPVPITVPPPPDPIKGPIPPVHPTDPTPGKDHILWGRIGKGLYQNLGRKSNLADAERLAKHLRASGYEILIRRSEQPPP